MFYMPCATKFRIFLGSAVGASLVLSSMVSPATAQDHSVWLEGNQIATLTGYLLEGENVYAVCDQDCSDLDLFLYDEKDALVAFDDQLEAASVVTAPHEGTFSIVVSMPVCNEASGCSASVSSDHGF
jgi:hypothetical protein